MNSSKVGARKAKAKAGSDKQLCAAFNSAKLKQRRGMAAAWHQGKEAGQQHTTDDGGGRGQALHSLWEMNDLQGFLNKAEQEAKDYAAEKDTRVTQGGVTHVVQDTRMTPFSAADVGDPKRWYRLSQRLPIPLRPPWQHTMRKEEVEQRERAAFVEWRRALASIEEREGVLMTPFERNLEVWRQLWRVVERSDVVMMIVDARNPLAFRSKGCEDCVRRAGKHLVLLLNKAELLTAKQRRAWGRSFQREGVTALFFSAARAKEDLEGPDAAKGRVGDEVEADAGEEVDRVAVDQEMLQEEGELDADESSGDDGDDADAGAAAPAAADDDAAPKTRQKKPRRRQRKLRGGPAQLPRDDVPYAAAAARSAAPAAAAPGAAAAAVEAEPPTVDEAARTSRAGMAFKAGGLAAANRYHAQDPSRLYTADELVDYMLLHRGRGVELDGPPVVIGFIGYPNVGKSSTINALWQSKRVTVSATPGKTKHFQTLRLEHERRVMLCDCPGLVFPSFASTRDHMVVDGVLPIAQLRDAITPMLIIAARIPRQTFELKYTLDLDPESVACLRDRDESPTLAHRIANQYSRLKGFMTDHDKPNTNRGARAILQDYVDGRLVYVWPPPDAEDVSEGEDSEEGDEGGADSDGAAADDSGEEESEEEEEFEEVEEGEEGEFGGLDMAGIPEEDWADIRVAMDGGAAADPASAAAAKHADPRGTRFNKDNANMGDIYGGVLGKAAGRARKQQRKTRATRNHQLQDESDLRRDADGNVIVEVSDGEVEEIELPEQPADAPEKPLTKRQLRRQQQEERRGRVGCHRRNPQQKVRGAAGYAPLFSAQPQA